MWTMDSEVEEERQSFYHNELSQVSSFLDSWQEVLQDARRQLEKVQRQTQISCQQKAPGDIRPAILQGFTVNLIGVRRQAKTVNDLLHRIDRIQQENEDSDEVKEILKDAAHVKNVSDLEHLVDRVENFCIRRSQQCFSVTEAYVQDFGKTAKMLFEDMQQQIKTVEDFMEKHNSVTMASAFIKANRGIFARLITNALDGNKSCPQSLSQTCRESTKLRDDWDSSSSNGADDVPPPRLLKLDQSNDKGGKRDLYQSSNSVVIPWNTDALTHNLAQVANRSHVEQSAQLSDWDASSSEDGETAAHKTPAITKSIQANAGQGKMGFKQCPNIRNNDVIANDTPPSRSNTTAISAPAPELSDWDASSSDEEHRVAPPACARTIRSIMNPRNMAMNESTKVYCTGKIVNSLTESAKKTRNSLAATKAPRGHSSLLSDWESSSDSNMDEGAVVSIAPISTKEIRQSYKCQRKITLEQSVQNDASDRTKRFIQNFADAQSTSNRSKHVLESDSSRDDMIGTCINSAPGKTQTQTGSRQGTTKPKDAGNSIKSGIDGQVKQIKSITSTKKTANPQSMTKPHSRIKNCSDITTPDGRTQYGPDGLTPNGMNRKEIEKMDGLFCVEKKSRCVENREDDRLDPRQSNHNDQVTLHRAKSSDKKASDKKNKNSNVCTEQEKSGSHGIIGRISSALGDHVPVNKGNERRDGGHDSALAREESGKKKGRDPRKDNTEKVDKHKKKTKQCSPVFYPKEYAPVDTQDCYSRNPLDEPDEYSTPVTGPSVATDDVPRTRRSVHHVDTLAKELDLTVARATNIRVLATRDWHATGPKEIGLRKGTIVKQKRAMNSLGMAFGWKKTRYGMKKQGYFPSAVVILYPTEENYARLGLTLPPAAQ